MSASDRPARSYPLRTLLLWLVVGLVVPTLALAVVAVQRVTADSRATAERRILEEARELSRTVDDDLGATIRALTALATSPSLTRGDVAAFRDEALRHLPSQPTWHTILLARSDGRNVVNTQRPVDTPLDAPVDLPSLQRTVDSRQPTIGAMRADSSGQMGFPVRVPVIRDGAVRFVLSAVLTPERLAQRLRFSEDTDWLWTVLNAEHVIVARSRSAETFVGRRADPAFLAALGDRAEAVLESVTLDAEDVFSGVSRGPYTGWRTVAAVPRAVVDADYRRTMTLIASVGGVLLFLGGVASLIITRRIARDMSMATSAAAALVEGRPVAVGRPRLEEVRSLAEALTRSAALLRAREEERDARLAQADAARADAEAANRAKDEFLAMLGHELRNPLAPVLNALHVARLSGGVIPDRERRVVERQVRHMTRLVDDLLDMSRIHHGTMDIQLEACDLRDIVNVAVEMTRGLYEQQKQVLTVEVADGIGLACDAHRMTQVLVNLLANATKYTGPGGRVSLLARREGDEVVIVCEDNGLGLAPDLLERVFEPFVQGARSIDRRQGGLGLGLAVARGIVERHGGRITATSAGEGQGSRFEVRLPAAAVGSPPPVREHEEPLVSNHTRVLIVEDNADVRDMLVMALSTSGVEARGVGTAEAAMTEADTWQPDVAVLDIGLPDTDGYQLARQLRARPDGARLRLMALTGYGGESHAAEARAAGFDAFLVKPVDVDALLDAIAKVRAGT